MAGRGRNMDKKQKLIEAAEHWEREATRSETMAKWNRHHGIDLSAPGMSAGDFQAKSSRCCARALRLEAATGLPHCMCHELPRTDCPSGGMR